MLGRMASRAFARVLHASWTRASVPVVGAVSFAILGLSQPISLQDRLLSYEERIKLSNTFKPHPKRLTRVHESNEESEKEEVAQEKPAQEEPAQDESSEEAGHLDMEEGVESAFDERTGEINWDCPCLGGMADGPCGEEFKKAFSALYFRRPSQRALIASSISSTCRTVSVSIRTSMLMKLRQTKLLLPMRHLYRTRNETMLCSG